jgi:predicted RNase H-like HicB family nuclease
MTKTYTAIFQKEGKFFVATCLELGVVSQGKTLEEATVNLQEAVELYLEDNLSNKVKDKVKSPYFIGTFDVKVS